MITSDDAEQPAYETAALHHDAASRLLVALGYPRLASRQASRLSRTLRVEARTRPVYTSGLPRSILFGAPTGEVLRPAASEKGLQQRVGRPADADDPLAVDAFGDGPTYEALQQVVPEWYEMHNAHCIGCVAPLLLGVNATFASHARGIVCRTCGTLTPTSEPNAASKRAYSSLAARKRAKAEEASAQLRLLRESEMKAKKRKQVSEVSGATVTTLAQRQAELRRKAKLGKRDAMAGEVKSEAPASPTSYDAAPDRVSNDTTRIGTKEKKPLHLSSGDLAATLPRTKAPPSSVSSTQSFPQLSGNKGQPDKKPDSLKSRTASNSHKDALRQMLDAKRKQKSQSAQKNPPSSGLQDFLRSL